MLENVQIADNVLLTGAGFTHNFGGFLAEEMWSQIFNHPGIRSCPKVAEMMLNDFDYESVYHAVVGGDCADAEKGAVKGAISEAYEKLDEITRVYPYETYINLNDVNRMISLVAGRPGQVGFFFTLNQDIFVERHFLGEVPLAPPWVRKAPQPPNVRALEQNDYVHLPTQDELQQRKANIPLTTERLMYVKLHGSLNWLSHYGEPMMVIGYEKENQITKEPVLEAYAEIFKEALLRAKRLLVIGYGFRDPHINEAIAMAITAHHQPALEMYVISPESPRHFVGRLRTEDQIPSGADLLSGLKGYFPYSLGAVFPCRPDGPTHVWKTIRGNTFGF